jgi:hypothetical protein
VCVSGGWAGRVSQRSSVGYEICEEISGEPDNEDDQDKEFHSVFLLHYISQEK